MKKFLTVLLVMSVFILTSATTNNKRMLTISQMIEDWQRAKTYTKDYLDSMPDEGYSFKPTAVMRSFAQQYLHIAAVNFRYVTAATGRTNPYPGDTLEHRDDVQTKTAVINVTMRSYDAVIDALKTLTESDMSQKAQLYDFTLTKEEIFLKGFEHQTHHRGQTTVYLRLKGVTPPGERLF
jgi:uncharacterized damage-inducible protein DinB